MAHTFTVPTSRGSEEVLARELRRMGLQRVVVEQGAVRFMGALRDGLRACLWTRVGSRVLLRLARFEAHDADALYQGVAAIPWADHLSPDGTLRVEFAGTSRAIRDERFGAVKTKDAIVDVMRARAGRRPDVARERPDVLVNVHLRNGVATVSLDLAGSSLHLRTPGRKSGLAPLKETLGATLLLLADWPRRARAGEPFVDPLCGAGTLAIEAAAIADDLAPGLSRTHWGFTRWLGRDDAAWSELVGEAEERRRAGAPRASLVLGTDADARSLGLARENARSLGLEGIRFETRPLEDLRAPDGPPGVVVTNPPYGERLASLEQAAEVYQTLGDMLRRHMLGWDAFVLAPLGPLARSLGLRPRARHVVYNGPIECRVLELGIAATAPARVAGGPLETDAEAEPDLPSSEESVE
jgi:23S rRNA (guanine2445-N2)-methyltransferase / 23S rRNA (guanine2069-N7)-methyltransferase